MLTKRGNKFEPVLTKITDLEVGATIAGKQKVDEANPGGLLGIETMLDPSITKSDGLSGQLAGAPGTLPDTSTELTLETHLLERVVGSKGEKVEALDTNETLLLVAGTQPAGGKVLSRSGSTVNLKVNPPLVVDAGQKVAFSRRIENRFIHPGTDGKPGHVIIIL